MRERRRLREVLIEQWERDHPGWKVEDDYAIDPLPGAPADSVVIRVREVATDDTLSGMGSDLDAAFAEVNRTFERRSQL